MNSRAQPLANRSVFLTGHTGFKGAWLCHWLHGLGCRVHGFSLDPPTSPSMFAASGVPALLSSDTRGDLRDKDAVAAAMQAAEPDVVMHLAAQTLVGEGYLDPLATHATNIMGTAHVLEAVRSVGSVKSVVIVTTDKVYDNKEWVHPYREPDPLGGHDPYSASKAAAEIVTASYRASYFSKPGAPRIATARAGNVIGGGDWAANRLVPDCMTAFASDTPVQLRYPDAVRPWQHVLEPLAGYIALAEAMLDDTRQGFDRAWNFGPDTEGDATVGFVAQTAAELWGPAASVRFERDGGELRHEAGLLRVDSTLARVLLAWQPRWDLARALAETIAWHKAWLAGSDMAAVTRGQIDAYRGQGS